MKFSQIKTIFFSALGITTLADNKLTADQEETLKTVFGEDPLAKFKAGLSAENPEDHATGIHAAMKAFFTPQAEEATADIAAQLQAVQAENNRLKAESAANRQTIATLLDTPENLPNSENLEGLGQQASKPMKVNTVATHYARAMTYSLTGVAPSGKGSIDVADLRQEFGTYLSQGVNNLDIIKQIFNGFTSSKHFRTVPATTEYRAVQSMINSVVQQFKPKWTPKGKTKFTPLKIPNFRHKINVEIIPSDVVDSYMFHLYDESLSPSQMPITKYIINVMILPQILDDIELRMIFKGKYVESTDDEATPAEESMDGIETFLIKEKAKANTKVNFFPQTINWVTATDAQVVKFVENFADFVDDKLKIKTISASKFVKKRYQRAYESVYGGGQKQVGGMNPNAEVDYVEMEIIHLDGMGNSPIIFATVPGNMVKLRHINEAPNIINKIVEGHYQLDVVGEFWLGAGFAIAEALFAYVPDGYDPQDGLKPDDEFPDGTTPAVDAGSGSGAGGM
ncbi:hypothetical protein HCX49_21840 [Sphingobacterium kitahiroshimense]|uniref:hypothetical protein n=1 Tax=Sphingobacterium sp. B16(2022) TaxID=2914044 RepID=UPI0014396CF4|nr:hypothetical protein [Sphingobacterium sp. B16(2022)]NJI75843.1 hypothetical protein [Sphingobacterium sp. B16(2022)]